mmetsp:Transcript_11695/g.16072  ORF Transcript_11695/g.16072 Transcript_11695/m.16072 type:complete len:409 (+) Transcript_11695:18-1244(+)
MYSYANLQSFFSIIQTVGAFGLGVCLDKFGVKGGFILSFVASALCYGILSQSTTIEMLYLSKVPTIFQSAFLCAQVAISQATTDGSERVEALGRLTVCYTIGSIIGPTVGGILGGSGDYYFAAKIAVAGSILSTLLTLLMPSPSSVAPIIINGSISKHDEKNLKSNENNKELDDDSTSIVSVSSNETKDPTLWDIIAVAWLFLLTKVVTNIANAILAAALPLVLKNTYGLNETAMGFTMSIMSAFNAIVNAFFLGPIVGMANGDLNLLIGLCILIMTILSILQSFSALPIYTTLSFANGLYEFLGITFTLSMCQYVLSTTLTGESTARVGPRSKGTLLGMEHSIFAAVRVFSPKIGVLLLQSGGVSAVAGVCAGVFAAVYSLWQLCSDKNKLKSAVGGSGGVGERKEK